MRELMTILIFFFIKETNCLIYVYVYYSQEMSAKKTPTKKTNPEESKRETNVNTDTSENIEMNEIEGNEEKKEEKKEEKDNYSLLKERVPLNIKPYFNTLSRYLEDVSAQVTSLMRTFFNQPGNVKEYQTIVVKAMEFIEDFHDLSGEEKKMVVVRCSVEFLDEMVRQKLLTEKSAYGLSMAIPSLIEALVRFSKDFLLNRKVVGSGVVEVSYVLKRTLEQAVEFIREKKYDVQKIMENAFEIGSEIMYFLGSYPSLKGSQKKEIVMNVFEKILANYSDLFGNKIPSPFVKIALNVFPQVIETLYDAVKGKINININKIAKCCPSFFKKCKFKCGNLCGKSCCKSCC
jgi:hypothetical protein